MKQKLFAKDFTLVVIGQIISLFGNATVRFALPLYLLNQTGSSVLYGMVTACALFPAILLSPVGGMVADRVNKRNIMVILDFFMAAVIGAFSLFKGAVDLVPLMTVTMMLLYGIAGAYQPSVQASIPALVSAEHSMAANSIINTISSFASLLGPVLGGIVYSTWGLEPVLWVCMVCFFLSAVMELFIRIPFVRQSFRGSIWKTVREDFSESIRFIWKKKPVIGKVLLVACGINLFLSSMNDLLTIFTVQMLSFVQTETPQHLIGKVIAVMLTVSMCAQPLGNTFYGVLFEACRGHEYAVILFAGVVSMLIAVGTKNVFKKFS